MSGAVAAALSSAVGKLIASIAIGNSGGQYGYRSGVFGSLSRAGYVDNGGNARTVARAEWDHTASGNAIFSLSGTSVTNSDTTFTAIVINGAKLTRASGTYTANDGGGRTQWAWTLDTSAFPTTGNGIVAVL